MGIRHIQKDVIVYFNWYWLSNNVINIQFSIFVSLGYKRNPIDYNSEKFLKKLKDTECEAGLVLYWFEG